MKKQHTELLKMNWQVFVYLNYLFSFNAFKNSNTLWVSKIRKEIVCKCLHLRSSSLYIHKRAS